MRCPSWRKGRFCGFLIDHLVHHDDDWASTLNLLAEVIQTLRGSVFYRRDLAINYLLGWRIGTSLNACYQEKRQEVRSKRQRRQSGIMHRCFSLQELSL